MKYIVDIKGEIEGDYEIIGKYEERPQGEWLHEYILDYRCSICNSYPLERGDYPELSKYCPACGARMNIEVNNNG